MAPALSDVGRKRTFVVDAAVAEGRDASPERPKLRRAFSSVDNVSPPMEDPNMGLQNAANLLKESQEMDQMLGDLGGGGDLGQVDILQVIKTMEGSGVMFPLAFERHLLGEDVDSDVSEERARSTQARLERRCAFLQRRLRMQQARTLGKRAADEAAAAFERAGTSRASTSASTRRDSAVQRPAALKALLKRLETSTALQARGGTGGSLGLATGTLGGLELAAGALRTQLAVVQRHLDSDATASSSGAESNDEPITYNNPHQQTMPLEKRALWIWNKRRSTIAARWSWLSVQVQELEYKIRQHTDLHKQVRTSKGPTQLVGGYSGPLPGDVEAETDDCVVSERDRGVCSRTCPLDRASFRKRKLLQMHNLHTAAPKAAKPADVRCGCQWPLAGCAVCTGRAVATQPLPPTSTLCPRERRALVDPSYHPVLSDRNDVSASIAYAAVARDPSWQSRVQHASLKQLRATLAAPVRRPPAPTHPPQNHHDPTTQHSRAKRTYKLKRGRPSLSRRLQEDDASLDYSPAPSPHHHDKNRSRESSNRHRLNSSYDIDNIVIPHSVAANTRLEILQYKEILTPKWRVMDVTDDSAGSGTAVTNNGDSDAMDVENELEDISEASVLERHKRCELKERGKYQLDKQKKSQQRKNSDTHTSTHTPPLPTSQQPQNMNSNSNSCSSWWRDGGEGGEDTEESLAAPSAAHAEPIAIPARRRATHEDDPPIETVRPYSPRAFPLPEAAYCNMLRDMPPPAPAPVPTSPSPPPSSSRTPPSPSRASSLGSLGALDEDPDDPEWVEPHAH